MVAGFLADTHDRPIGWNDLASIRPLEERDLEQHFGEDYIIYKTQIRNWIPNTKPAPLSP